MQNILSWARERRENNFWLPTILPQRTEVDKFLFAYNLEKLRKGERDNEPRSFLNNCYPKVAISSTTIPSFVTTDCPIVLHW